MDSCGTQARASLYRQCGCELPEGMPQGDWGDILSIRFATVVVLRLLLIVTRWRSGQGIRLGSVK